MLLGTSFRIDDEDDDGSKSQSYVGGAPMAWSGYSTLTEEGVGGQSLERVEKLALQVSEMGVHFCSGYSPRAGCEALPHEESLSELN